MNAVKELVNDLKTPSAIAIAFFVVSLFAHPEAAWQRVAQISLIYSLCIYLSVFLAYKIAGNLFEVDFKRSFLISIVGVSTGAMIAQVLRAQIESREVLWHQLPNIILIGAFISLMFIYRGYHLSKKEENEELIKLNAILKSKSEKKYLLRVSANHGNQKKIIETKDIKYFISMDHYTHAVTSEGEYIVDLSIKKLNLELNPNQFVQIHRNSIVNLNDIKSIENGSQWIVKTKSGTDLSVSRNSRKRLKEALL